MSDLKPHQLDLLCFLVARNSPTPPESLDGRNLRPLKAQGFVVEMASGVVPTEAGRTRAAQESADEPSRGGVSLRRPLSEQQEEVLRYLLRQTGPVPADHLDGRVLGALRKQALVHENAGWVSPAHEARDRLATHVDRQRVPARGSGDGATGARAQAILRAVEQLEAALPRDTEIMVRDFPAYADDVVKALRQFARRLGSGSRTVSRQGLDAPAP